MKTIEQLRKQKRLTRTELGAACGVSSTAIWSWERAGAIPPRYRRDKVAEVLGVKPSEIIWHPPEQAPAS